MKFFRIICLLLLLVIGLYAASMYFVAENRNFKIQKVVSYPIDKVFPQFNNFQNFIQWNAYFKDQKNLSLDFFTPYQGLGSSVNYKNTTSNVFGDFYIREEKPLKSLYYEWYENNHNNPYRIRVSFKPISAQNTQIEWDVFTPKQPWMKRSINLFTESQFVDEIDRSMKNLSLLLSNKVDKEKMLQAIKYDSLMVETSKPELLLGTNVSASNKKNLQFKNIITNHNKVYNFITMDLSKKEDEIGFPVMITDPNNYMDKEVSYFYGFPISKKMNFTDNNFVHKYLEKSTLYVIYFKGAFRNRVNHIKQLLHKAKKDTMRHGELMQTFIEVPTDDKEVNLKIALPVYK